MITVTPPRRAWVQQIMGMPVSVHLRGRGLHTAAVEDRVAAVFAGLRHADDLFSTYRADSQLSCWERGELTLDSADTALAEVLELCEQARQATGGYFDVRSLPDPLGHGPRVDPSGLVKGWAVQRAAAHLGELAEHGWCVNAGGDILMRTAAGHPAWRAGIEHPADRSCMAQVLTITDGALATSGTAARGRHIVDPHTGEPATGLHAVSVTGPSLLWADVYATAAAARGPDALAWLEAIEGYEGLLISARGSVTATAGWPTP